VSPRDNHPIHLKVLMPVAQQMAQHILEGKFSSDTMEAFGAHINEHFNRALQQGVKPEQLQEVADFVKKLGPALNQLKAVEAQAQQVSQASAQLEQDHMASVPTLQPPQ
jgi:hypothetical protein